jgi:hypothetical protein
MKKYKKHLLFFTIAAILAFSFSSSAQTNPKNAFGGEGIGNKEKTFSDSIPVDISERIYTYLQASGIKEKHRIVNFENKRYFLMAPLKKEDVFLVIWADFYFDANGNLQKKITKISDLEDVDCAVLGERICEAIENFKIGYEEKYGAQYEENLSVVESSRRAYIEVAHRMSEKFGDEINVKFDFEGNYIEQ